MDITYKDKKLEKICTEAKTAERTYGRKMAMKIKQRIFEMKSAESVESMVRSGIGRCHCLTQNRKGQYAVDLVHPYRLVFEKVGGDIRIVKVLEIVDYH